MTTMTTMLKRLLFRYNLWFYHHIMRAQNTRATVIAYAIFCIAFVALL